MWTLIFCKKDAWDNQEEREIAKSNPHVHNEFEDILEMGIICKIQLHVYRAGRARLDQPSHAPMEWSHPYVQRTVRDLKKDYKESMKDFMWADSQGFASGDLDCDNVWYEIRDSNGIPIDRFVQF